jgi:hypothetical protein
MRLDLKVSIVLLIIFGTIALIAVLHNMMMY